MKAQRRYKLENIYNCRDLGGYETPYGVTEYGRFLRCGIVEKPTDNDIDFLKKYGVKTIFDLRGTYEAKIAPNDMERMGDVVVHQLPLYEIDEESKHHETRTLPELYQFIVESYRDNICRLLTEIAQSDDGAVMYHCYFGKDRTGIASLMLLSIAGVDEDDIVADYQQTYTYIESFVVTHGDVLWSDDDELHYSRPETMRFIINFIKEKYGSVLKYIKSCHVSDETIEKIRAKFF